MQYPPQIEIQPLSHLPHATVRVPGSKSITNRALVLAALTASSEHDTVLEGALQSEDTEVMVDSLNKLGFQVVPDWNNARIRLLRPTTMNMIPANSAELYVANSGTSMRFLTAMVALSRGRYRLDGVPRMRERPIEDLLDALRQLDVEARSENGNGCPPVVIESRGLRGGSVRVKGNTSSQFLSGLLMAAPFAHGPLSIEIEDTLVSVPYITMTVAMMRQFGLAIDQTANVHFQVPAPQKPRPLAEYAIEPDASAASYFFGAAAITGGSITVAGLPKNSMQGDVLFVEVLEQMGCRIERDANAITVHGGPLHGINVDMNAISDTVMTLGAVACFATGSTIIRNVAHIRHKETDRLAALTAELRRIGAVVEERDDSLTITPRPLHGAVIATYNDHRMAMSLALVGLKIPGVIIDHPACVAKRIRGFLRIWSNFSVAMIREARPQTLHGLRNDKHQVAFRQKIVLPQESQPTTKEPQKVRSGAEPCSTDLSRPATKRFSINVSPAHQKITCQRQLVLRENRSPQRSVSD